MSDPHQVSYDQPTKNDARRLALSHAVELITSRRENAVIVPADHTHRIRDHLLQDEFYGDRAVALACQPRDLESWRSFRLQTVGTRTSSEITVAYLAGPEPSNDMSVLLELGIRPENIWAFEIDEKTADAGLEELRELRARGIKFIPVGIEDFFIGTPRRFDIIYFDACGAFPSKNSNTLRALATMFRHSALAPLGVLVSNFACPDTSQPDVLDRYSFLIGAYLYPKSFMESKTGGSIEGPPAYGYIFNYTPSADDDDDDEPLNDFIDEVKANFEHYYGQFITRSLMDLATIVAPMSRLMSGNLWKVAFDDDLNSSIERGKRLVVFKPDVAEDVEAEVDIGQEKNASGDASDDSWNQTELESLASEDWETDGDAICNPNFFSLIWTLAACGRYPKATEFPAIHRGAESLIRTWRAGLLGKVEENELKAEGKKLEDLIALFYAWRHDPSLWTPAMQRIEDFLYSENMPMLCDVPTTEIGFYPVFAQLAYPAHPNVRECKRFRYVAEGKVTSMFTDVIAFDECRYVHDWISALHLTPEDWEDLSAQLTFRFALDGIAREKRWMGDDFLYGCHAVGESGEFPMSDLQPRLDLSPQATLRTSDDDGAATSQQLDTTME
ncbi:TPA: class I SAM-dependent methyltransferase [Escherichia coli]|nr:class I SAM-dependent methyltransferase [Escherichia coli]